MEAAWLTGLSHIVQALWHILDRGAANLECKAAPRAEAVEEQLSC